MTHHRVKDPGFNISTEIDDSVYFYEVSHI